LVHGLLSLKPRHVVWTGQFVLAPCARCAFIALFVPFTGVALPDHWAGTSHAPNTTHAAHTLPRSPACCCFHPFSFVPAALLTPQIFPGHFPLRAEKAALQPRAAGRVYCCLFCHFVDFLASVQDICSATLKLCSFPKTQQFNVCNALRFGLLFTFVNTFCTCLAGGL